MAIGKCFSVIVKSINSDSVLDPNLIMGRVEDKGMVRFDTNQKWQ